MFWIPPLLAVDWIQIIIVILFLLGPLLGQLGGDGKKAKQGPKPMPRRRPQPRPGQQQRPGGRPALQNDIDEFLRQAQAKGGRRQQQPKTLVEKSERQVGKTTQSSAKQPAAASRPLQDERPRRKPLPSKEVRVESVAEHVRSHIESDPITKHSRQLGQRISQADEAVEQHLHEVFDHKVGSLDTSATDVPVDEGTDSQVWENLEQRRARNEARVEMRTADIARIMRNPVSMREAIILGEILKPPKSMQ